MKYFIFVFSLLLAGTVFAQTANVIELDPSDSDRAQKAWNLLQKAQADWDKVQTDVQKKYVDSEELYIGLHTTISLPGFQNGFEFSKDFRFIVPKINTPTVSYPSIACGSSVNPINCRGSIGW